MSVSLTAAQDRRDSSEQTAERTAERVKLARAGNVHRPGRIDRAGNRRRVTGASDSAKVEAPAPALMAGGYMMGATELAHACGAAATHVARSVRLSDDERDALAQAVAFSVLRNASEHATRTRFQKRATDSAERTRMLREVERQLTRAERFPHAFRADAERTATDVPRGMAGRSYLRMIAERMARESREWRDVAATYSERARADREQTARASVALWSLDALMDGGTTGDHLTTAALRSLEREQQTAQKPADVVAPLMLAQGVATVLMRDSGQRLTEKGERCLTTALRVAAGEHAAVVAARSGRSLKAVRKDVEQGRAMLRDSADDVRAAVDYVTRRLSSAAGVHVPSADERAAADAVDRCKLDARQRATGARSATVARVVPCGTLAPTVTVHPPTGAPTAEQRDRAERVGNLRKLAALNATRHPRLSAYLADLAAEWDRIG